MSWWSRIANVLRRDRLSCEIDEELASHFEEAIEQGREPAEARRAYGSALRRREESRDIRLIPWLDSLRADATFGWRQLMKRKVTSAAAILSLALAIGACTAAFRLIDAVLLRPLPVAEPYRLYGLFRQSFDFDGKRRIDDSYEYPLFRQMRAAVSGQAELIAVSGASRADLTYGSDQETEKAYVQNVSGWMFTSFGLRPAVGRLLTANDDVTPGAHPYAVLSYDYWKRRFAQYPKVVGRTFRADFGIFEIVGVGPEPFTGNEPGTVTDIFIPMMMHAGVTHADWSWFRILVRLKEGVAAEPVLERLRATFRAVNQERAKGFVAMPKRFIDRFFHQTLLLEPAAAGISNMQRDYSRALAALGVLVSLVLLIACANVANLMTAQAAARAREMALRLDRRGAMAAGATGPGGKHYARNSGGRHGRIVCLVVRAVRRRQDQSAGQPRALGFGAGLAGRRFRFAALNGCGAAVRATPGAACLGREASQRIERRGRPALAAPSDACTDRGTSNLLFCRAVRRRIVCRHVRSVGQSAHRFLRRTPC